MHLESKLIGKEQIRGDFMLGMFVAITPELLACTETVEIWGSDFSDNGPDHCEVRFFKANAIEPFKVSKIAGY